MNPPVGGSPDRSGLRLSLLEADGTTGARMVVRRAGDDRDEVVEGDLSVRLIDVADGWAVVESADGSDVVRTRVAIGPPRPSGGRGRVVREVIVDGWLFDVVTESEHLAALRERASRGETTASTSGPLDVRAIIPGRIVALSVVAGDTVAIGQQLLVLEAMKMQNELRAPRDGTVGRVAVAVGDRVEVGDVLLVLQ